MDDELLSLIQKANGLLSNGTAPSSSGSGIQPGQQDLADLVRKLTGALEKSGEREASLKKEVAELSKPVQPYQPQDEFKREKVCPEPATAHQSDTSLCDAEPVTNNPLIEYSPDYRLWYLSGTGKAFAMSLVSAHGCGFWHWHPGLKKYACGSALFVRRLSGHAPFSPEARKALAEAESFFAASDADDNQEIRIPAPEALLHLGRRYNPLFEKDEK